MKKLLSLSFGIIAILVISCNKSGRPDLASIDPGQYDTTWYNHTPLRFVQTNLNETDADMDVDKYLQSLLDVNATMVVFNVGGIRAMYPTQLPFHHKSPYLKGDLVGEAIKKLQENGIRFIARFDMSKINESIAAQKPEWLYVGTDGKIVNYNGEVHVCINGGYQQEYIFEILKEAISTYPFDAVFFNMSGYRTTDYDGVNHGICQCRNCKKRFHDSTGLILPVEPNMNDAVYRKYREFQASTTAELNHRIIDSLKSINPNIVLQIREGEMVRSESGTGFTWGRDWNYHATDRVKSMLGSYKNKTPNNTLNYLIGMDYRHTATSPNIGKIFLAEQMLNGAGPGIYFMSRIEKQYDREFLPTLKEFFEFHKTNEKLFTNVGSLSKVGLIMGSTQEYRGIMKLLIEEHIMYDLIETSAVESETTPRNLDEYDALILSNVTSMNNRFVSIIDDYVKNGGKLLATGFPGVDPQDGIAMNKIKLQSLGVMPDYEIFPKMQSTYLKVSADDKAGLGQEEFRNFDLIMMNSEFLKCKVSGNATAYLKLLPNTMHGPPEKCYFTESEITDFPGIVANSFGEGKAVFIPWQIGSQYAWKGNNGQRTVFMAAMENLLSVENILETDASPLIEVTHIGNRNEAFEWIGMINHSGQLGDAFREPVPIFNTNIRFKPAKAAKEIWLMRSGKRLKFKQSGDWIECLVPEIHDFEMMVCIY